MSFFERIKSNFEFKKVTCCLYHSGTVRHSTVNRLNIELQHKMVIDISEYRKYVVLSLILVKIFGIS